MMHTFQEYCADHGIQHHLTAPYTPQQNGVVERRNQTVLGMARSMMKGMKLPGWFWGEAVTTAVYILNRSPTRSVEGMTPFEAWYGTKPPVHFFRVFGCVAHVKTAGGHQRKLDDRSTPMVFVGYEPCSKAYRFYNPDTKRVVISRDAVFNETRGWDWKSTGEPPGTCDEEPFKVEFVTVTARHQDQAEHGGDSPRTSASPVPVTSSSSASPTPAPPSSGGHGGQTSNPVEFCTPPSGEQDLDADHDDGALLQFRRLENVLGSAHTPGLAERVLNEDLLLVMGDEPATFAEAQGKPCWEKAMIEEMSSIEENNTWTLVDLPPGHRPIGLKWVFKVKRNETGAIVKYKARLVAKGYVQQQGVDYDEVFAPVARMESVRMILAIAARERWLVHHMDVKSAFLNGELTEEVYVQQPPGFTAAGHDGKVLRLRKALYGLRQAPRAWNVKLDTSLRELGFIKCSSEHGMYTRGEAASRVVVGVYVDDLIITGASRKEIGGFKVEMHRLFRMSDLGLLSYYLGIEVKQTDDAIILCQGAYAQKLLDKARLAECNPCQTPMEARLKLSKVSGTPNVDATLYRSLVGSLRYLVHTRPDISFAVGYVSRYMESPQQEHMGAVKHLLRYIAGTIDFGLRYARHGNPSLDLVGYSDSDLGGDIDDRKSTTGIIFFLDDMPVSWQSQKQRVVALSSCEAEYIAGAAGACQAVWLARLRSDVLGTELRPPQLRMDNMSAIALSKNPVLHDRSKHIDTKFHFIRECVEGREISLEFASSQEQLADILTKSLGRARFCELREKIGVAKIK